MKPLLCVVLLLEMAYGLAWRNYSYEINKNDWEYLIGDSQISGVRFTKTLADCYKSNNKRMEKYMNHYDSPPFTGWESQKIFCVSFDEIWECRIANGVESKKWWWF